jgi:ribosomal protein S18 acetylase RimI-like enzyme
MPEPAIRVRSFEDADAPAVIALWSEVLPPNAPHNNPATSLRMKLAANRDLLLVAEEDAAVVGTVMGGWDGHRGWIYSLAVRPDRRRRGIGSGLVCRLVEMLADRGCLKVNLQVRESNAGVVGFYEQLGFSVEPLVSMGKRLYE